MAVKYRKCDSAAYIAKNFHFGIRGYPAKTTEKGAKIQFPPKNTRNRRFLVFLKDHPLY